MDRSERRNQPISILRLSILYSLSQGTVLIPYYICYALSSGKTGNTKFLVPTVIVYTVQRACLVALRGFGEIINPYRIMKGGLCITLFGALLLMLSPMNRALETAGAVFIGIGMSPFGAMFVPTFLRLKEKNPSYQKSASIGSILYLLIIILITVLEAVRFPFIQILFFIYIACALFLLCSFDGYAVYPDRRAFDTSKRRPVYFLFGILVLLCLLVLRQYKQSGISFLIWLAPAATLATVIVDAFRIRNKYKDFAFRTYWAGAAKNFLLLFSMLYHASVGRTYMIALTYLALTIGGFLPSLIGKPLKKLLSFTSFDDACIILAAGFSFLLASPLPAVNFIGITLSGALCGMIYASSHESFMKDERHIPEERSLVERRIFSAGGILNQVILLSTIYLLGKYRVHKNLLDVFSSGVPDPDLDFVMRIICLICNGILLLSAILITLFASRQKNAPESQSPVSKL